MSKPAPPITLREAAQILGVSPDTLRQQVHRKRLTATKLGRDWFVTRAELAKYLKRYSRKRAKNGKPTGKGSRPQ